MGVDTNSFLACCFHPTTVILIDDDKTLLNLLELQLKRNIPCYSYSDALEGSKFLEDYHYAPFTKRCVIRPEDSSRGHRNIDIDLTTILFEVYNSGRFKEICVVIVDYVMPQVKDPKAFCQKIKSLGFKVILLTGEADEKIALALFNEGAIDKFIRKDTHDFSDMLLTAIQQLQAVYFKNLSGIVIDSLTQESNSSLNDPAFIDFFQNFMKKHDFVEYYLYEATGSFLFLDANAKPSWLIVKDEDEMNAALFDAETNEADAPTEVIQALASKEKLLHRFLDEDYYKPPTEWGDLLHSAKKIIGKTTYYYAYIENPKNSPIDQSKIISLNQYLESL